MALSQDEIRRRQREGIAKRKARGNPPMEHMWLAVVDGDPGEARCAYCSMRRDWPGARYACPARGAAMGLRNVENCQRRRDEGDE